MSSAGFKNSANSLSHCIGNGCSTNLWPVTPFATAVTGVIGCRTITTSCMCCAATQEAGKGATWFGGMLSVCILYPDQELPGVLTLQVIVW